MAEPVLYSVHLLAECFSLNSNSFEQERTLRKVDRFYFLNARKRFLCHIDVLLRSPGCRFRADACTFFDNQLLTDVLGRFL